MGARYGKAGGGRVGSVAPVCLDASSDASLAARLLDGRGRRARADALLRAHGGWWGLRRLLASGGAVRGLGAVERGRLAAAIEIGRRGLLERTGRGALLSPDAVVARYRDLALQDREVLLALGLDPGRRLVCEHRITGGVDGVAALPRDLLRPLIAAGATAMIALHNHPSGSPCPSEADIAFTRRLAEAGALCGLPLLDHLIVAGGGWRSLVVEAGVCDLVAAA